MVFGITVQINDDNKECESMIPPTSSEQLKTYELFYFDTYPNNQVYEMTTCLGWVIFICTNRL